MVCLEAANNPSLRTGEGSVAERLAFWREAPGELAMWQSWPQLWLVQLEDPALTVAKLPEHCAFILAFSPPLSLFPEDTLVQGSTVFFHCALECF